MKKERKKKQRKEVTMLSGEGREKEEAKEGSHNDFVSGGSEKEETKQGGHSDVVRWRKRERRK